MTGLGLQAIAPTPPPLAWALAPETPPHDGSASAFLGVFGGGRSLGVSAAGSRSTTGSGADGPDGEFGVVEAVGSGAWRGEYCVGVGEVESGFFGGYDARGFGEGGGAGDGG